MAEEKNIIDLMRKIKSESLKESQRSYRASDIFGEGLSAEESKGIENVIDTKHIESSIKS